MYLCRHCALKDGLRVLLVIVCHPLLWTHPSNVPTAAAQSLLRSALHLDDIGLFT